ncbi:Probable oxidoreductase [Mycobacteroides abscessus subsp. massiliense]|nr:Probable oxidoreductase [Mycobacteroides abscessus subsp. massiliense]
MEIHPRDAATLGISEGDIVDIASRRGTAELPAIISDRVKPGSCFAPFHWNDAQGPGLAINAVHRRREMPRPRPSRCTGC